MTAVAYAGDVAGSKKGPDPQRGVPKEPFSTRLPADHVEFLRSRENTAAWLESKIDADTEYVAWMRDRAAVDAPGGHWCDECPAALAESERLRSSAPIARHLEECGETPAE